MPEALINFTALLGWSPYGKNIINNDSKNKNIEILSIDQLIKKFDYHKIGTSPAIFDIEKLDYFNGYYIRQTNLDKLVKLCLPFLYGLDNKKYSSEYIKQVISLEQERLKKISDIKDLTKFFFIDKLNYSAELLLWKKMTAEQAIASLKAAKKLLTDQDEAQYSSRQLKNLFLRYIEANDIKTGEILWPLRVALTGLKGSPDPFDVASIIGKILVLKRIDHAIEKLEQIIE